MYETLVGEKLAIGIWISKGEGWGRGNRGADKDKRQPKVGFRKSSWSHMFLNRGMDNLQKTDTGNIYINRFRPATKYNFVLNPFGWADVGSSNKRETTIYIYIYIL